VNNILKWWSAAVDKLGTIVVPLKMGMQLFLHINNTGKFEDN
jgi:hypothetical protein